MRSASLDDGPYLAPEATGVRAAGVAGGMGRALLEFLLVGGVTLVLFPLSWLLREGLGLEAAEYAVGFTMFHAAHVINDPHFSVTYLLFYEDAAERALGRAFAPAQRVRYWLAGVVVPAVLAVWGIGAITTASPQALGALLQLMFLLVGWHYVKQGFGVMIVLAARRGVRFGPRERQVLLAHCFSGWAYAWASPSKGPHIAEVKGVVYTTFGRPLSVELVALVLFGLSTLALFAMLVGKARREGRAPLVTPLVAFLCSIWLWSIYASADPLVRYAIPALHSLQYLYFVWLLKRAETLEREREPFLEAPSATRLTVLAVSALALGWLFFDGAPVALDGWFSPPHDPGAPATLGPTPYFAAVYAFVNIHHYFMDNVIWRRDNPRTRYLARQPAPTPDAVVPTP